MEGTSHHLKNSLVLIVVLGFVIIFSGPVIAQPNLTLNDVSPTFNFTIGNWSQTYNLSAIITAVGGNVIDVNLTWYMPYGLEPNNYSECNATTGFTRVDKDTVSCSINLGTITSIQRDLIIKANVSAFPRYDSIPLFIYANVTNGTITNQTTLRPYYGKNYWINPRVGAKDMLILGQGLANNSNSTVIFEKWNQTDPVYQTMTPLYAYDANVGMPILANNTYADVLFFGGKEMIERPSWMRLWGYNLTFKLYFNGSGRALYWIYSPVNNTVYPEQTLFPLYIYTQNVTDPMENASYSMTLGTPSQEGFTVWYNGSEYNQTSLAEQNDINISFSPVNQADLYVLQVNASSTYANDTEISILFTIMNFSQNGGPSPVSPLYVDYQNISGFSFDRPPEMGQNITTTFIINVSNRLTNYTLDNLKLHFFMPLNVSMETNAGTFNFTMAQNINLSWYDTNAGVWNSTITPPITSENKSMTIQDNIPGSPSEGNNITIWFASYDIDLSSSFFNNWDPGSSPRSNASMKFTANLSFPALNESFTSTTGSIRYTYNATVSMSMQAGLNLTGKVPGLDTSSTDVVVIVDGTVLNRTTESVDGNYTVGSLTIDNLGSGTHSISVSYTVPSAAAPGVDEVHVPGGGGTSSQLPFFVQPFTELTTSIMNNVIIDRNLAGRQFYDTPMTLAATLIMFGDYPVPRDISGITLAKPVKTITEDVYEFTATKVLEKFYSPKTILIARGDLSVDSMAAIAYAKANNLPILLTRPGELPSATLDAVKSLNPSKIIIAGGSVAVSEGVESKLKDIASVERKWGATRYETAIELAKTIKNPSLIVITQGYNPVVDAIIISSVYKAPLIYVGLEDVPQSVKDYLTDNKDVKVLFVGVSKDVASEIESLTQTQ